MAKVFVMQVMNSNGTLSSIKFYYDFSAHISTWSFISELSFYERYIQLKKVAPNEIANKIVLNITYGYLFKFVY